MVTFEPTHNGRPSRHESGTAFYDGQCFVIEHGGVGIQFIRCDWTSTAGLRGGTGSVNRLLLQSPHVAGVAAAIFASPDADIGFVGLTRGTLIRNIGTMVVVIV